LLVYSPGVKKQLQQVSKCDKKVTTGKKKITKTPSDLHASIIDRGKNSGCKAVPLFKNANTRHTF
jgi:hypothetical protein